MIFSSAADSATFSGGFGAGFISLGSGNDNITFDGGSVAGTTITGTDSADTLTFVGDLVDEVVFDSAIGSSAQISLGNGDDLVTFNNAISAATIYGGSGADSRLH